MMTFIREHNIACPECGGHDFTDIRQFELMFETSMGVVKDAKRVRSFKTRNCSGYLCKLQECSENIT